MDNYLTNCVGWDIGGAHIKIAYIENQSLVVKQWECPLWKGLNELVVVINEAIQSLPKNINHHHVTMTGELVDIFMNRQDGVSKIIRTFSQNIPDSHIAKYFSLNGMLDKDLAIKKYQDVASANWIASGKCIAKFHENTVFVDIGSTTTDVLEIANSTLVLNSRTDFDRLRSGELVYTGVVRSCVNTIIREVKYKGDKIPLIAELFAVSADVYRILGKLPDRADLGKTMDGQAKDKQSSMRRLARMLGEDYCDNDEDEWMLVANEIAQQQRNLIVKSIAKMLDRNTNITTIIGAGVGRFLLEDICEQMSLSYIDFISSILPKNISYQSNAADCAPAVALLFE